MRKYIVRFVIRETDCVRCKDYTVKATSVADALSKANSAMRYELPFGDVEVEAVWNSSTCECKAKRRF